MVETLTNIERSIHKTNRWINEVNEKLEWDNEQKAYTALEETLRMIRDILTIEEATDFGSQIPMILRGAYYTNYNPSDKPLRIKKSTFVSRVHSHLENDPNVDPNVTVQKIFNLLDEKIENGEINDVKAQLPEEIQKFWELKE